MQLRGVYRVAQVVARTVCDVGDETLRIALRVTEDAVRCLDYHLDKVDVLPLVEAADVVRIGHLPLVENEVDGPRVVLHVKPVANVLALAVHRKGPAVPDIVDEKRYQLLRELVRTVVVRAVRNYGRHAVGVVEGTHEVVGRGLRRTVRTVGAVPGRLTEELVPVHLVGADVRVNTLRMGQFQGTVHLVRRDVVEQLTLPLTVPVMLGRLKQRQGAEDIGPREGERVLDRAVHVALGSKVDHAVDAVFLEDAADRPEVADVGAHEHVVRGLLDVHEVGQVARVGQLVQVHYPVLRVPVHEKAHDVAPDEARTASYQYVALVFHNHCCCFT